ncbi:MAG: hypothetical protein IT326_05370 [Anaerolineae bacterium]|nr:hypothetical protein [Anaerolineae bacterium]
MASENNDTRRHGSGRGITGAVILIGLGVAFLLSNLGIVTFNWVALLNLWPVLLILVGIDLLIGRRSLFGALLSLLAGIIVVAGALFYASSANTLPGWQTEMHTQDFAQPLEGARSLAVVLNVGAAQVNVHRLEGDDNAAQGFFTTARDWEIRTDYSQSGGEATLTLTQENTNGPTVAGAMIGELDLFISGAVPVELIVNSGASAVNLDLNGMDIRRLEINGGAGETTVLLPERGDIAVIGNFGVGSVTLHVPEALEGRLSFDGVLTNINTPARFESLGEGVWETAAYRDAVDRVTIDISGAIGTVNVRDE